MKTSRHQIAAILGQQLMKKPVKRASFSYEIASYLLTEHRAAELEPLLRDIIDYRAQQGMVEVTAISAHELSGKDRTDIELFTRQLLPKAKSIILNTHLDPNLIGGVRLEIVSQQLDLSIRTKLNRLKQLTNSERTAA
jgi:F0F1-type ATP synthase delta subunit